MSILRLHDTSRRLVARVIFFEGRLDDFVLQDGFGAKKALLHNFTDYRVEDNSKIFVPLS